MESLGIDTQYGTITFTSALISFKLDTGNNGNLSTLLKLGIHFHNEFCLLFVNITVHLLRSNHLNQNLLYNTLVAAELTSDIGLNQSSISLTAHSTFGKPFWDSFLRSLITL